LSSFELLVLAIRYRSDQIDGHANLVRHAHDAEQHRCRGHYEVAELPTGIRRGGCGEIAAVALGHDVERDLLGLAADGHLAGQCEREAAVRRERQGEPAHLCGHELGLGKLADLQGVLLDEAVAIALIARERADVEADLRSRREYAIAVQVERPDRAGRGKHSVGWEADADKLLANAN